MTYEPIPPYTPRVPEYQDLPDKSTPVLAQDINAWQTRLALLTDAANTAGQEVNDISGSLGVIGEQHPAGTMLASDGTSWVALPAGSAGQVLTPDANIPLGVGWSHSTARVGVPGSHAVVPIATPAAQVATIETRPSVTLYRDAYGDVYLAGRNRGTVYEHSPSRPGAITFWTANQVVSWVAFILPPALRPTVPRTLSAEAFPGSGVSPFSYTSRVETDGQVTLTVAIGSGNVGGTLGPTLRHRTDIPLFSICPPLDRKDHP